MKNFYRMLLLPAASLMMVGLLDSCKEDDSITASKTELTWTKDGGKKTIDITSNCSWKVQAIDAFGAVSESEIRTFTTGDGGAYKDGEVTTLFGLEPYKTYKDYFRVSTVAVYSQERGATVLKDMSSVKTQKKNTACNYDKVFSYAKKVQGVTEETLQNTTVFLLININAYAGTCMMESTGRSVSMCPMGDDSFEPVVCHEGGGHGFGRLLDEYRYTKSELPNDIKQQIKTWRSIDPYYGYNVDITGNRDEVHWKHYYDAVGMYEGACLYDYGAWRPEYISCMEDNRYYYNAPSREAIVRRIMKASGKTFNMDDFIAKDIVRSTGQAPETRADYVSAPFVPFAPPVLVEK